MKIYKEYRVDNRLGKIVYRESTGHQMETNSSFYKSEKDK